MNVTVLPEAAAQTPLLEEGEFIGLWSAWG